MATKSLIFIFLIIILVFSASGYRSALTAPGFDRYSSERANICFSNQDENIFGDWVFYGNVTFNNITGIDTINHSNTCDDWLGYNLTSDSYYPRFYNPFGYYNDSSLVELDPYYFSNPYNYINTSGSSLNINGTDINITKLQIDTDFIIDTNGSCGYLNYSGIEVYLCDDITATETIFNESDPYYFSNPLSYYNETTLPSSSINNTDINVTKVYLGNNSYWTENATHVYLVI